MQIDIHAVLLVAAVVGVATESPHAQGKDEECIT